MTARLSRSSVGLGLIAGALLLGGCATTGPLHLYATSVVEPERIHDVSLESGASVTLASWVPPGERVVGLGYDPFTDHLFLRLAPGDHVRVVDRPAGTIKREWIVEALSGSAGGDLAIRPRDGHVFFAIAAMPELVETDRFGNFVRRVRLADVDGAVRGVAWDPVRECLLILAGPGPLDLSCHDENGRTLGRASLPPEIARGPLAYHPARREIYVPSADGHEVLVLDETGRIFRRASIGGAACDFFDVGERSFVRVF